MDRVIRQRLWRVVVVAALMIGLGWPAISANAQQPRSSQSATPAATPIDEGAVTPLSTATLVPADAAMYFAVNLDTTSAQWTKADELLRRTGLGDVLDQVIAGAQSELQSTATGAADLHAFLGGEVAVAVTNVTALTASGSGSGSWSAYPSTTPMATPMGDVAAGPTSGIVAIARTGNPDQAEAVAGQMIAQETSDQGLTVADTTYRGVTIHVAASSYDSTGGVAYARLDDFLILSATAADLEPVIDVAVGDEPALADQASFRQVRQELPSDFLVYSYTNGPAYVAGLQSELRAAAAQLGPDFPFAAALAGLNVFSGEVIWADDPGFRTDTISVPAVNGTLPPAPANFDMTLDARVPDDTLIFADSTDLGPTLGPSLDALGSILAAAATADPDLARELPADLLQGAQSGDVYAFLGRFLAFNPRTALIDQLVGEWAFALSVRSLNPSDVAGVFVSDAKNEAVLNDTVTKLAVWLNLLAIGGVASAAGEDAVFGNGAFGAHTEEVNGTLTQVIEIPIPERNAPVRVQWGVVKGQIVFGIGDGFVSYLNGPVATLADSPRYRSVMAELPAEHNGVFYLNLAEVINLVQPLVQQEIDAEQGDDVAGATLPDLSGLQSFAMVSYERDGLRGTSSLLMIAERAS